MDFFISALVHLFRHFGCEEFGLLDHYFLFVVIAGMDESDQPKNGRDHDPDDRENTETGEAVEKGVHHESTPFFPVQEIQG